jgi:hypothetical protein
MAKMTLHPRAAVGCTAPISVPAAPAGTVSKKL